MAFRLVENTLLSQSIDVIRKLTASAAPSPPRCAPASRQRFFPTVPGQVSWPPLKPVNIMSSQTQSTLYAKLLGETATISWPELQPFFAKGSLLWVDASLDLIAVAEAMAEDDRTKVSAWLAAGQLERISAEHAEDWQRRSPYLWAVVVAPWVLVQERDGSAVMH